MHLGPIEKQPGILQEMAMPENFRLAGWVYILSNEYMPGIYKVGMTTTGPEIRAKEISSATGVPYPFKIEAAFHSSDPAYAEREIHDALSEYRINESREFFKGDLEYIKDSCGEFCEAQVGDSIQNLAMSYDIICLEETEKINIFDLFEELPLSIFGDKVAVAERLIRIGAEVIRNQHKKTYASTVFLDNKAFLIEDSEYRWIREEREKAQILEEQHLEKLHGPHLPTPIHTEF